MNHSRTGDRDSKSVFAGDTDQTQGLKQSTNQVRLKQSTNNQTERSTFGLVAETINLLILH